MSFYSPAPPPPPPPPFFFPTCFIQAVLCYLQRKQHYPFLPVSTVFSCVQTMLWLPSFANLTCAQMLMQAFKHWKRVCRWKSTLGEKSLVAPENWNSICIAPGFSVWYVLVFIAPMLLLYIMVNFCLPKWIADLLPGTLMDIKICLSFLPK